VTHWGHRSVHEIKKRDIRDVIEKIYHGGAHRVANTSLVAIKVFFKWCVDRGILDESPCKDMRAIAKERSRDRILSDNELCSVLKASREIGYPFGSLAETLILTAQRKSEVAKLTWKQIHLDSLEWRLPAENSKNGKAHVVHLSEEMVALLEGTPRLGPYVFSTEGSAPYQGFSKAKARLDRASGVTDWTLHDLRRTAVSGMARLGVAHHVADKVLNHQSGAISGVAAVYQRHEFLDERKRALEAWGRHVAGLLHGATTSNVVEIRRTS
jgi:integrase